MCLVLYLYWGTFRTKFIFCPTLRMNNFVNSQFTSEQCTEKLPDLQFRSLPDSLSTVTADQTAIENAEQPIFSSTVDTSSFIPDLSQSPLVGQWRQLSSDRKSLSPSPHATISSDFLEYTTGTISPDRMDTEETVTGSQTRVDFIESQQIDATITTLGTQDCPAEPSLYPQEHRPKPLYAQVIKSIPNQLAEPRMISKTHSRSQDFITVKEVDLPHPRTLLNLTTVSSPSHLEANVSRHGNDLPTTSSENVNWRLQKLLSQLSLSRAERQANNCDPQSLSVSTSLLLGKVQSTQIPGQLVLCFGREKR